jgi:hypothetical protein
MQTELNKFPGAGSHEHKVYTNAGVKYGFGSSSRDGFKALATPGPG